MKKIIFSGLVGLALVGFTACGQKVDVEPEQVSSKCDMGKAVSKVAKCGAN